MYRWALKIIQDSLKIIFYNVVNIYIKFMIYLANYGLNKIIVR